MQEADLPFMRKAIEEARKCQGEDERDHPKVGAIVVKDGMILATGYRGEVADGEHAEFTTLEKKLAAASVTGATVYTTLEPCTSRNHPKVPCATRLVERRVKRVVIGMLDPNPNICGRGLWFLREARIETDLFPHELMSEIEELNREFIRAHRPKSTTSDHDNTGKTVKAEPALAKLTDTENSISLVCNLIAAGNLAEADKSFSDLIKITDDKGKCDFYRMHYLYHRALHANDASARGELQSFIDRPQLCTNAAFLIADLSNKEGSVDAASSVLRKASEGISSHDDKACLILESAAILQSANQENLARDAVLEVLSMPIKPQIKSAAFSLLSELISGPFEKFLKAVFLTKAASLDPNSDRRFYAGYALSGAGFDGASALQYEISGNLSPDGAGSFNNAFCALNELQLSGMSIDKLRMAVAKGSSLAAANMAHRYIKVGFYKEAEELIQKGLTLDNPNQMGTAMTSLQQQRIQEAEKWKAEKKTAYNQIRFFEMLADAVADNTKKKSLVGAWIVSSDSQANLVATGVKVNASWVEGDIKYRIIGDLVGSAIVGKLEVWSACWDRFEDKGTIVLVPKSEQQISGLLYDSGNKFEYLEWNRPIKSSPTERH